MGNKRPDKLISCYGSGQAWVKSHKKTCCPVCNQPIAKIGGHPNSTVPAH